MRRNAKKRKINANKKKRIQETQEKNRKKHSLTFKYLDQCGLCGADNKTGKTYIGCPRGCRLSA